MPKTAKKVLEDVVELLNTESDEGRNLWEILSALRGPDMDDPDESLKFVTTARIRSVIGIEHVFYRTANPEPVNTPCRRQDIFPKLGFHFAHHYESAVRAIKEVYGYDLSTESPVKPKV